MIRMRSIVSGGMGIALLALGGNAFAGSATSNLTISASVSDNCTISTSAVAFGAYDPVSSNASSALTGTGSVTVTCTSGASATVLLSQGSNAASGSSDAAPLRAMGNGSGVLAYGLYQDSGRTTVWGNTSGTGASHTGTGTATTLTVYGSVFAGQNVTSGNYTDTITATVNY